MNLLAIGSKITIRKICEEIIDKVEIVNLVDFTNKNYLKCTLNERNNLSFLLFELKNKHGKQVFKLQLSEKDLG